MTTQNSASGANSCHFPQINLDDYNRLKGIIRDHENDSIEPEEFATIHAELMERYGKDHIKEAVARAKVEIEEQQFQEEQAFYTRAEDSSFPAGMDKPAFRAITGEVIKRICYESEICEESAVAHFLCIFGNMLGRGLQKSQGGLHVPLIWPCITGDTGLARKGVGKRAVHLLIEELDSVYSRRKFQTGLQTPEALVKEIANELKLFNQKGKEYIAVKHVYDKRLIVEEQELTRIFTLMQRPGNTWSEVIRKLYDAPISIDAKASAHQMFADQPFVAILGHVTREGLKAKLPSEAAFDGLVNRFTFIAAYRKASIPEPVDVDWTHKDNSDVVRDLKRTLDHFRVQADGSLIDNDTDPDSTKLKRWTFNFTASGRELWHKMYKELDDRLESTSGINRAIISRSHPTIMRLAIIYAALDRKTEIATEHLESARAFWDYAERSALWTFGDNSGNRDADAILTALRQHKGAGMSLSDITRLVFHNRDTYKRDEALSTLHNQGRAVPILTRGKGTKRTARWYASSFAPR